MQVWEHAASSFLVFCGDGSAMGMFRAGLASRIAGIPCFDVRIQLEVCVWPGDHTGLVWTLSVARLLLLQRHGCRYGSMLHRRSL